jgi:peptidoglycan/xylan/chitin deacetylase (PgdA/CDA1 family)
MILGLRIDVCTHEGLRVGVPNLLSLLERRGARASFFVALGPDRSGRALFRVLRPGFLAKMWRTRAIRTYGWRTILSGTVLPARHAVDLADVLRAIPAGGHELAVHGYDHRRWQDRLPRLTEAEVRKEMVQAVAVCQRVTGRRPDGFGAPGWQCNATSLRLVDEVGFAYASDTRGRHPFYPSLRGARCQTLQLPTTLPTLDEVLGLDETDGVGFLALVSRRLEQDPWPVFTMHAEMEGRQFLWVAEKFLAQCAARNVGCHPLAEVAKAVRASGEARIPSAEIAQRRLRGRAGCVAVAAGLEPTD